MPNDRAGSGWSETGAEPRTMQQEVSELQSLLRAARVPGPYVLVDQSYGGLLLRLCAPMAYSHGLLISVGGRGGE